MTGRITHRNEERKCLNIKKFAVKSSRLLSVTSNISKIEELLTVAGHTKSMMQCILIQKNDFKSLLDFPSKSVMSRASFPKLDVDLQGVIVYKVVLTLDGRVP